MGHALCIPSVLKPEKVGIDYHSSHKGTVVQCRYSFEFLPLSCSLSSSIIITSRPISSTSNNDIVKSRKHCISPTKIDLAAWTLSLQYQQVWSLYLEAAGDITVYSRHDTYLDCVWTNKMMRSTFSFVDDAGEVLIPIHSA